MKRRLLSLLLVMVMVLGMLPTIAFAAPTESSGVYQIGTAEDLLWFAQEVNGGNTGISGVLTADIDMSAVANWPGIGTNHKPFSGSFDGQGHMVTFRNAMWGMFGFVAGKSGAIVTIQNVKTAGGAAGIGADKARGIHTEVPQRLLELQTAPAHIGTGLSPNLDLGGVGIEGHSRLVRLLAVDIHKTGHDDGLGLGTSLGIHLLHEEHVQSFLILHVLKPRRQVL